MNAKRNNGIGAKIGSLFGRVPEKRVTPHIYVSTENEVKKRRAKAKERAAGEKQKAAEQAAAASPTAIVPPKGAGKIRQVPAPKEQAPSALDEAALGEEEGFMQKVKLQKRAVMPRKSVGLWTMVRDRFTRDVPATTKASTEKVELVDMRRDPFLQHASAAPSTPLVRVEADDPPVPSPTRSAPSALDEAVSGAKDTDARKEEIAKAIEDNRDIVDAKKDAAPPTATAPAAAPAKKKVHVAQFQTPKGFKAFMTSINYIGMGKERMAFIQNMATMLNAGLPLTDSLKTLVLETRNRPMRKLIQRIVDQVENGSPLWRAMEAQSFFSLHALALVRIGEEAGNLSENMGYLAEQDEKDHALRSKVKMAMIYPTIVMCIMFVIVVGLGMFVLPNLVGVLFSLNVKLPLVTRIVIWCSDAFVAYGPVGVPSSIAGFIVLGILSKYTPLGRVTQWAMFRIPGIGKLAREATIARFGVILGGLLKAGVPVVEALESLVQVTPIISYKKLYAQLLARVAIGDSFQKCFATIKGSQKLLPASVQQLVITGEKSGSLADIMLKVADIYDKKASETAEKLPIILEPMLLLFIGGLVGSIAFAIIVPIYSIVGNVGNT